MTLHARDAAAVETLRTDCRRLLGGRLLGIALYGEVATEAYRPLESPLDVVILLEQVRTDDLRALRGRLDAWQRKRVAIPLVIDPPYLATSRDVFPLELLELRERHRLVDGAHDPFATLAAPDPVHLRLALEQQLKGKLLHLREGYVALGSAGRGLDGLLRATRGPLDLVLRGLLALADRPRPPRLADVIQAVTAACQVPLPTFELLERWHLRIEPIGRTELEGVFARFHDELSTLALRVDRR